LWIDALAVQSARVLALSARGDVAARASDESEGSKRKCKVREWENGKEMFLVTVKGIEGGPQPLKAQASNYHP